jgi:APA family basic amino acid/polyamine antiporter
MADTVRYEFKRRLNVFDSTMLVMGSMIGSGIFIVSADMARELASPGWLLVAWALTGVMTVIAAISYGELAAMMPQAGGIYVYLREAYSPLFGFLYGWTLFLVIQTGTIAAVGMAFAKYLGVLIPSITEANILLDLGVVKVTAVHFVAIASIVFLTWVNMRGVEEGKWVQNIFTFTKAAILILFVLIGFWVLRGTGIADQNPQGIWNTRGSNPSDPLSSLTGFALMATLATAMVGSLFSADAWYNVTFASAEVINPKKTIPVSLFLGTVIVTLLYFLVNVVYLKSLPLRGDPEGLTAAARGIQYAAEDRVGTASMYQILGKPAEIIMALAVVISTFGCNNGIILTGARVYYAMAQDGLFFRRTGILSRRNVPAIGLAVQGVWGILLCLSGTYSDLLDYVIFAVMIFNVLIISAIYILRKKRPEAERPYRAFGYPVLPAVYVVFSLFVMLMLLFYKPKFTWPGLIIVLIGIPVYYLWKRSAEKSPAR